MFFYYLFPVFVLIIALWGYKKEWVGIVLFMLMLFFSMFRGDYVGTDTIHYLEGTGARYYQFIETDVSSIGLSKYEIIFFGLNYLVYLNDLSPRVVIYFFSIITFLFLFLSARRFKVNTSLVALFYIFLNYYFWSFNVSRQLAALSICLFAISYINEKDKKKYLFFLWIIIASLIHNATITLLVVYLFKNIKVKRNVALLVTGLLYVSMILIPVTQLILVILKNMGFVYTDDYGLGGAFKETEMSAIGYIYQLINGFLLLMFYKYRTKEKKTDFLDVLFLFSMIVTAILVHGNLGTWRLTLNYTIIQCLYLSSCYERRNANAVPFFWAFLLMNYVFVTRFDDGAYYLQF